MSYDYLFKLEKAVEDLYAAFDAAGLSAFTMANQASGDYFITMKYKYCRTLQVWMSGQDFDRLFLGVDVKYNVDTGKIEYSIEQRGMKPINLPSTATPSDVATIILALFLNSLKPH